MHAPARVDGYFGAARIKSAVCDFMKYPRNLTTGCRLRLDGSIDVAVVAGGYMSTLFWQARTP